MQFFYRIFFNQALRTPLQQQNSFFLCTVKGSILHCHSAEPVKFLAILTRLPKAQIILPLILQQTAADPLSFGANLQSVRTSSRV